VLEAGDVLGGGVACSVFKAKALFVLYQIRTSLRYMSILMGQVKAALV
jgi:hypothetical protein